MYFSHLPSSSLYNLLVKIRSNRKVHITITSITITITITSYLENTITITITITFQIVIVTITIIITYYYYPRPDLLMILRKVGSPAIDAVCIFAGNYCTEKRPCLHAGNNPQSKDEFNPNIKELFKDNPRNYLQDKGITVLLTILNGQTEVGWSNFQSEDVARDYVLYLKEIVDTYGFDGIDIDDEYSKGLLIMNLWLW